MRAGTGVASEVPESGAADLLAAAASLRWVRPDLTADLADHVLETAALAADRDGWLAAAGWAVHARTATGDGRDTATRVIGRLALWGAAPLSVPAARRLRVELALLAVGLGETRIARRLLAPVTVVGAPAQLQADAYCVLARCAIEDAPDEVALAVRCADVAWTEVSGAHDGIGAASVALVTAVAKRRAGRPQVAAERAAAGLTALERERGTRSAGTPSGYLAAALAAEWISSLLDAGRADDASAECIPLTARLAEPARPSRQLACLRLAVARAAATGDAAGTADALERATRDAADCDVPDLEAVCRSALGAVHEQAGRLDAALEALRLGIVAERRDRGRAARLRAALVTLELEVDPPDTRTGGARHDGGGGRRRATEATGPDGDAPHPRTGAGDGGTVAGRGSSGGGIGDSSTGDQGSAGRGAGPANGRRRRPDDPWATGRWTAANEGDVAAAVVPRDAGPATAKAVVDPGTGQDAAASGSWLHAALADLDRIWGRATVPVDDPVPEATEPEPDGHGCVVVIDIARDGRRFAGRRAAAVLHSLADRLTDHLPPGARLRQDGTGTHTLSIVLRGWGHVVATDWMHRALPAMLEGFRPDDDLPGTQLRAAVHDADGPVGAQILQHLDPAPTPRRDAAVSDTRSRTRPQGHRSHPDPAPSAAAEPGADGVRRSGRRRAVEAIGSEPSVEEPGGTVPQPTGAAGRHEATGRTPFRLDGVEVRPGSGGRRHRRVSDAQEDRSGRVQPWPAQAWSGHPDPGHPDPGRPDPERPDPERPDPERPDPERPDLGRPAGQPDRAHPDAGHSDAGRSDLGHPDAGRSAPRQPDPRWSAPSQTEPGQSGPMQSELVQPETGQSGARAPGSSRSGPSRPGPRRSDAFLSGTQRSAGHAPEPTQVGAAWSDPSPSGPQPSDGQHAGSSLPDPARPDTHGSGTWRSLAQGSDSRPADSERADLGRGAGPQAAVRRSAARRTEAQRWEGQQHEGARTEGQRNDGEQPGRQGDDQVSTEGLGLADLLAGALAAYRGI